MNNPTTTLVTGRYGIGPIALSRLSSRMAFLRRAEIFLRNKEQAIACALRGDREGARFWGAQARCDWSLLSALLANPAL